MLRYSHRQVQTKQRNVILWGRGRKLGLFRTKVELLKGSWYLVGDGMYIFSMLGPPTDASFLLRILLLRPVSN